MFRFSNAKARDLCDTLLRSCMESVRTPRETWLSRKKAFEVILRNGPDVLDRSVFSSIEGVVKVLNIKFGHVVLFMSSLMVCLIMLLEYLPCHRTVRSLPLLKVLLTRKCFF